MVKTIMNKTERKEIMKQEQIRLYNKYICNYCNTNSDNSNAVYKCNGTLYNCPRYSEVKILFNLKG